MEPTPDEQDAVRRRMADLRAKAEKRRSLVTAVTDNLTPADVRRLVQELQVHQIELEMQYEELLLAQSERETLHQQYVDLFEFAPVGYCTLDATGVVQQLNLRGSQLLGVPRGQVLGRRFAQYVPLGDERTHFHEFLQRVMTTDVRQTAELEMQRPDGSSIFVLMEGVRLKKEASEARCRLAITDDTARRRAVTELAASEQKFRALFEDSADAALLVRDFTFIDCNRAALNMLGATHRDQLVGRPVLLLTPEYQPDGTSSAQRQVQHLQDAQRHGSHRFEWLRRRFTGEEIWQEVVLTPVRVAGEVLIHTVWRDITEQKRLDQRLRESEQRFRTVFEQSTDGMLLLQDGRYVDANPAALRLIGAERPEQLVGQTADVRTPEVQPNGRRTGEWFAENVEKARQQGSYRCEAQMYRFSGEEIWLEAVLTPIELPGQPMLTHICWRDVTERRRAEQRVQESETRLSTALDAAELGVAQWNFVTDEVFFDARARQMFGLPADAAPLTFPDIRALLHPDDRERVEAALQRSVAEHLPVEMDQRVVWPDGTVRYVVSSGQVAYDAAGQALRMTGVVQDVTEKRLAARQLQESEARLKTAVLAADMGIGIWHFDTQLFYVDERARRMFGLPAAGADLTFDELMAVVLPADRALAAGALQRAATEGALDVEVRVQHPDGTVRYVCANGQVMYDEAGHPLRMSGVLRDVTLSRLAEQRLRESEEQLRTALSAASMGVGLWEPAQQQVEVDARIAEIFGLGAGAGRYPAPDLSRLIHPDDLPEVVAQIQLSLQNHLAFSLRLRLLHPPTGELRHLRISGQALYDEQGQPARVAGVVRDVTEFRRANLRLRESEERLRLALQASHTGVFEWSFENDELFWDERTQAIFGRPYEDRRQSFSVIREAVHPADAAAVAEALTTTIRDGVPFELEHRVVQPDGAVRHVAASGQVHYDEQNRPQRLAGLIRDVTERRQAQEELGYKNRLLDHILSTIPVVLSRVAKDGTLQEVLGAGLRRLGLTDNAIVGVNVFETQPEITDHIERLLAGEEVRFLSEPIYRADEQPYFQNYGFFDEEKQCGVIFGIDVTDTHQANAKLAADATFLQGMVSNIQEGIMAFDAELRVTEWNYLMEQYLLVARQDVLGKLIFEALPPVDIPRNRDIMGRALAGETQTYYNVPFSRRQGEFDAAFVPLRDAAGAVAGVLGVIRDVTERNRLMEEATRLRLQREKEVLSAIMHTQEDERKRIAEALHNGVGQLLYAAKLHLYNQPVDEAHRASALGLLNEAIKATRTISFELTPNILEDFGLKTALEELCKRIPKQNLDVHLSVSELPAGLSRLLETAVYRIVQELLNNVIKHAQAREAFVYVEPQGPQLHVSVEDDGVGFDVEMATQKRGGIGLAGIRNRVSLLAGQLSIRSMPGRGTTISIELPLTTPEPGAGE